MAKKCDFLTRESLLFFYKQYPVMKVVTDIENVGRLKMI